VTQVGLSGGRQRHYAGPQIPGVRHPDTTYLLDGFLALARRKPLGFNPSGEAIPGFSPSSPPLACRISLWYTSSMRKLTTIRLDEADRAAIATIKERYGVASESDAIRLALRLLAESKRVDIRERSDGKREQHS
jgi:hypothetical protein